MIHGCIYQARPDVMSVCHHHAPAMMPYAISRAAMVPVYHLGASMGVRVPFWDSRDDFGSTALVLVKPEEGRSLAKALGQGWTVLMGRHGATAAGTSIREMRLPHHLLVQERRAADAGAPARPRRARSTRRRSSSRPPTICGRARRSARGTIGSSACSTPRRWSQPARRRWRSRRSASAAQAGEEGGRSPPPRRKRRKR